MGKSKKRVVRKRECLITPEMMDAGLQHLYKWHPDSGVDGENTVVNVYRAMEAERHRAEKLPKTEPDDP